MKIKGREVNSTFRKIIESGNVYLEMNGKEIKMPYEYSSIYDDTFSDYEIDIRLEITEEMEKNFTPDEIDEMRDKVEEEFDKIKVV